MLMIARQHNRRFLPFVDRTQFGYVRYGCNRARLLCRFFACCFRRTQSTEKKEESRDVITEAVEKQDSEKDNRNISIGEYRNTSDADTTKDSSASGDRKISVLSVESLERGGEREDSGSLHDYENVVLTQDGDGNTVVAVKAEVDSGSLHDYENVVLTTDGEGNTVVQVKDEVTSEEGGKVESVNGEVGVGRCLVSLNVASMLHSSSDHCLEHA